MISLDGKNIGLSLFEKIVFRGQQLGISEESLSDVTANHEFLKSFSKGKIIYGINTGLGPMAQHRIDEDSLSELQYNAIRSHASGSGKMVDEIYQRGCLLARLNNFLQARSGVHPSIPLLLAEYLNRNILPLIFEHGGVGASGDLVQLAHIGLGLIGEGEGRYKGEVMNMEDILKTEGLEPVRIHLREGLALINGTSFMTGAGLINIIYAKRLLKWELLASMMINELVASFDDHFSEGLNNTKRHQGQKEIASMMRECLSSSKMIRRRDDHFYNGKHQKDLVFDEKLQEYYSIRCLPQILGPVLETINNAESVLTDELNSVNDNPVIDHQQGNVYHGGNFHGEYVAAEMDKLKASVTKLSMLAERQLNYLLNNKINMLLPPFVNLGKLGINFGMQGAQFTATSTVAENQSLSFPMHVHSIPNNNDNQDIVSMGGNAALMCSKVIDNTFEVLAIHLLTIIQAVDYLGVQEKISNNSRAAYQLLREKVAAFSEDTIKYTEIRAIRDVIKQADPGC